MSNLLNEKKSYPPIDHQGTIANRYLLQEYAPGAHGWFPLLTTNLKKRPPGTMERHKGLNPSPLGTRSGANFANF